MSESSFPFEQPAPPAHGETDDGGRNPARVVLAGGLVVALALGGGAFFLLGGEEEADDAPLPIRKPAAAPAAEQAPPAVEVVPVASSEQVGRNPFKARYVEPKAAAAAPASASTSSSATTPASTAGSGAASSSGSGSSSSGTSGTGAGSPTLATATKSVSLLQVDDAGVATFVVTSSTDDKPTPAVVEPGEVFASYFRYINHRTSVGPDDAPRECAKVLVGDALIELCQNDSYEVKTS